jgi:ribosomal protein S9
LQLAKHKIPGTHAVSKPLCELKKSLKADIKAYMLLVRDPTHLCRKCGRVANDKRLLCKPMKLD